MKSRFAEVRIKDGMHTAALLLLILSLALPRLTALDRYVTIDEPLWLMRSANFYSALWNKDWKDTYQAEHPGVINTWAGAAGFLWKFPGYVKLVDEQFKKANKFEEFLISKSRAALDLLVAGRAFTALAVILILMLAFPLMVRLAGWGPALLASFLIALDPYFVALSRLLHLDGLVTALMLLSLLAFLRYLDKGRQKRDLLLSGVAAGLSWLTKSPAFFLIPFVGLLMLIELFKTWRGNGIAGLRNHTARLREIWVVSRPWLVWLAGDVGRSIGNDPPRLWRGNGLCLGRQRQGYILCRPGDRCGPVSLVLLSGFSPVAQHAAGVNRRFNSGCCLYFP
jgi:hypothetical protein